MLTLFGLVGAACDPPARQTAPIRTPAASPSESPAGAVSGGTFRYGIGEPTSIIPPLAATTDDEAVVDALFDSLVDIDVGGRPVPSAATSWTVNDEATAWTFALRPDATFHDGTPVTAAAFSDAWSLLVRDGALGHLLRDVVGHDAVVRGDVATLSGVRATDELTLDVTLVRPRGDFPILVSHPALGPVHPVAFAAMPDVYVEQPIGNGPFRASEPWAHDQFIRATRSAMWINGARSVDAIGEVLFRINDLDRNFLRFRDGSLDFAQVPPEAIDLAMEEFPPQGGEYIGPGLIVGRVPAVYLLGFNVQVPPFDDVIVREAVSLFIDRARIAQTIAGGNLDPGAALVPPTLLPIAADTCDRCTFNPTGAVPRLAQAGVDSLSYSFNAGGGHEAIRDVIGQALRASDIALVSNQRGVPPPFDVYRDRVNAGQVGMFRLTVTADVPSPLEVLYPLLHSSQVPEAGGLNAMRYADPVVDSLLDQASRLVEEDRRQPLLLRVQDIALNRDQVLVPVVTYRHAAVVGERVANLRYDPFGQVNLSDLRLLSLEDG